MIDLTEASVYTIPSLYMYHSYSEYTVSLSNCNWLILFVVVIFGNQLIPFESVLVIVCLRKIILKILRNTKFPRNYFELHGNKSLNIAKLLQTLINNFRENREKCLQKLVVLKINATVSLKKI